MDTICVCVYIYISGPAVLGSGNGAATAALGQQQRPTDAREDEHGDADASDDEGGARRFSGRRAAVLGRSRSMAAVRVSARRWG
jgi:hypothetical protein